MLNSRLDVKLGPRRNYHEGQAAIRHYANQPGEGPSRGLLRDCTTSPINRFAALVLSSAPASPWLMTRHLAVSWSDAGHYPLSRVETLQPVPALHMALPYKLNVYPPSHAFTSQPRTLVTIGIRMRCQCLLLTCPLQAFG